MLLPFTVVSGHHPQVKRWAGVLMPPLSKAGFWQWVLSVACIWHPTGLCWWMLLPPGTLPEGQSWTAPWAGSQEQRGGFGSGEYPLLQHSPPSLLFFRVFKKASPNGKVRGTW